MRNFLMRLRVGKKLQVAFTIVIGIFVVAIIASFFFLMRISNCLTQFYNVPYQNKVATAEIRKNTQSSSKNLLWAATTEVESETKQHVDDASSDMDTLNENVEFISKNFTNKELVNQLTEASTKIQSLMDQLIELTLKDANEEALLLFNGEYKEAMDNIQNINQSIVDFSDKKATKDYNSAMAMKNFALITMIVLTAVSILLAIYLATSVSANLTNPILKLEKATESLSNGELDIDITYESADELGVLSKNFRNTCSTLKAIISDLGFILHELSSNNLDVDSKCPEQYKGAFKPLLDNLTSTFVSLSHTFSQINESTEQVSMGSTQLAESAQGLAEGASEQASAVEELQATVSDVSVQIDNNTKEVKNVDKHVKEVGAEAEISNKQMQEMTEAMKRIRDTSKQIGEIIAGIEDIASQTNLLSLNAAIEAARAGEAGKGFAVVADQIRQLADESAKSAVNTRELIETAMSEVESGNSITEKTAQSLSNVIKGVLDIQESINIVTQASEKQAEAAKQISEGTVQISSVVQNNSAVAEETSATSEELSAQATTLNTLVSMFTLKK